MWSLMRSSPWSGNSAAMEHSPCCTAVISSPLWLLWTECLSVAPQFMCWNPNPQCDDSRRLGLWEVIRSRGWSLLNGISVLLEETQRVPLLLLPHEDTEGRCLSVWEPGVGSQQNLTMLAISRTVRDTSLLLISQLVYCTFLTAAWTD